MDLKFGRNKFCKRIVCKLEARISFSKKSRKQIHEVTDKLLLSKIISNRLNKSN